MGVTEPKSGDVRVRWRLVAAVSVLGGAILVAAWIIRGPVEPGEFLSGLLVSVGSAVLLAAFLFWLERSFLSQSRETARHVAAEVAAEAAGRAAEEVVRRNTSELSARLDSLQEQLRQRREEATAQALAPMDDLVDAASWDSVTSALQSGLEVSAIDNALVVLAGAEPHAPLVEVQHVGGYINGGTDCPAAIVLTLALPPPDRAELWRNPPSSRWTAGQSPVDAFALLDGEMIKYGLGELARRLDATAFFMNLRVGLVDAVAGRRAVATRWRTTAIAKEFLGTDWVVTDSGIEEREHGVVAVDDAFYTRGLPVATPVRPEWADPEWWTFAVGRRRSYLRPRDDDSPF